MSRILQTPANEVHSSGSWRSETLTELPRYSWRRARSYRYSTNFRTTVSSIGTDFSAAVAARSAGCSYAFGEICGYDSTTSGRLSASAIPAEPTPATKSRENRSVRAARAAQTFDATVAEAERCWYDTSRWSLWVDGLDRVVEVDGDWPGAGATVTWQSGPAGRGRVVERVIAHKALEGQALEVTDSSIRGRQSVAFVPAAPGV